MTEVVTSEAVRSIGQDFIFHIIGSLTIIWFVLWSVLVYNTPEKNRNLSAEAKQQIKLEMGEEQISTTLDIPWKHILCSRPVWMSIGVIIGSHCGQSTTNVGIRQYLKYVYQISNSLLSAIPYTIHTSFALLCGYIVDFIQKTQFVSVTSSRRMFVYISHFLPAGFIFITSFVGCDVTAPLILYSLSIIVSGAVYSGALCSAIDITPNFASFVIGLCCTFGAAADLLIIYVISQVLNGEVVGSWRITFSMTSLILLITSIFFMLRGSGSIQIWNNLVEAEKRKSSQEKVLQGGSETASTVPKVKNKVSVEEKILKVLYVQEPEKFTRVRAYSTSLPNENAKINPRIPQLKLDKKRASIS
ncbi:UNVERIFIED_CONTAM: hypothetical protein PYX00_003476 [Menopon gallinae]|uniref:Uncharacterized protein n=1 Tax=Menopon gallinae TaxID=328185 RepID=A0AAW2I1U0_9NEOP